MNRQIKKVVSMILAFVLSATLNQTVYALGDTAMANLDNIIESDNVLENSDDFIDTQIAGNSDDDLIEKIVIGEIDDNSKEIESEKIEEIDTNSTEDFDSELLEDIGDNSKEMESEEIDTDSTENFDSELLEDIDDNPKEVESEEMGEKNTGITGNFDPELAEIIIGEDGLELDLSDVELSSEISMTAYDVLGLWEGNYIESINGILVQESIRLVIEECTEDGKLSGTATITSENGEEYYFEGTVEFVSGRIVFEGTDMLNNPNRPIFPLLSGILHLEDMTINGVIDGDENKPFTLSKVLYDYATMSTQIDSTTVIEAPDYDIWLANTMLYGYENSGNGLYTTFQSFSEPVYMELGGYLLDDVPLVSMSTAWSVYFNSEYRNQFANEQKYIYEVILMEYLKYDSGYKAVKNELMNNEIKFSMKLYKTIANELSDNTLDYINNMTPEEVISLFKKTNVLDQMGTAISELQDGVDSVKDLINVFSEYMALQQVRDERVYLLRAARNACASSSYPNSDFIKAADELISIIEGSTLQYVQGKSLDYLWEQGCDYAWGKLCDANPILKSIELGVSGLNVCFDSTNAASNNLKLALLYTTDCYLKQGMMSATSNFMSDKSSVNAQTFFACFQAYIQFQMYGNDFAKTWLNGYLDSGVISNFVNMIFYRENISTAKEMIDRSETQTSNRKNILQLIDKYSNIYQHLYKDIDWEKISYDANIPVTGVCFSNPQVTLINKNSIFLAYANIEPSNATNKNITYTSSNPSILSVPENGGFGTVLGEGVVTITAKTEDGGYTATQTVTVNSSTVPSSESSGSCGTNVKYTLYDDGTLFVYGKGEIYDDDYSYGRWNPITHNYSDKVKDVIICEGITGLGDEAFYGCNNLKNISLPEGLTHIGEKAFYMCSDLKDVILPESITRIEQEAFWHCYGLESINFPESLTYIGESAFWYCRSLKDVVLPNGLTSIEAGAFQECSSLESVTLPEGLMSVKAFAFYSCSNLTNINLPEGLTSIGRDAFYKCNKLKSITLPESLQNIGDYAFYDCNSLTSIYLPQGVASVGEYAFRECSNIKKINLSKAVIGQWRRAFDVENFESITLAEDITNIGEYTFQGCRSLITINIPHTVKSIEGYAFNGCTSLIDVVLSEELTNIGEYAFQGCGNLENIDLPKGVISIEKGTFADCSNLISIGISQGLIKIGNEAFLNCSSLTSINLPEGITLIGSAAFENCNSLKKIIIPQGVEVIASYVFSKCSNLENVSFPKGVISIEDGAFDSCMSLTNVNLPEGIVSIGGYAFRDCTGLVSISIPASVTEMGFSYNGTGVFTGCSESLTIIGRKESCAEIYAHNHGINFEEAPCTGHVYKTVIIKAATCITNGQSCEKCIICNNIKPNSSKSIPATGHKYGLWETARMATVLVEGKQKRICSICGESDIKVISKLKPTIKLTASSIQLKVKQSTSKIKVTELAKGDAVKSWKSNNTKIVKVNNKGKITAQSKTGKATITVTLKSGLSKKITIKVQKGAVACTKVILNKSSVSLKKGKSFTLKTTVKPITCVHKIKYSSSNKKVATVSSKGKITAKKKGKATITVTVGKKKVKCKVTVK